MEKIADETALSAVMSLAGRRWGGGGIASILMHKGLPIADAMSVIDQVIDIQGEDRAFAPASPIDRSADEMTRLSWYCHRADSSLVRGA